MDLEVVMWGNAQGDPASNTTSCQHGVEECWIQQQYACAKSLHPSVDDYLPLMHCFDDALMTAFPQGLPEPSPVNHTWAASTMESCAKTSTLDYAAIDACANSDAGTAALEAEKNKTPAHTGVPFSIINSGAVSSPPPLDLITAVCQAYTGATKPAACTSALAAAASPYASTVPCSA